MPTKKQFDNIIPFLDRFEADGFSAGAWNAPDGKSPFYDYSEPVRDFQQALEDNGWIVASFDWPAWQEAAQEYVDTPSKLQAADEKTLQKLFTTVIRQERFCEGQLAAMFENGHIVHLLRRLCKIRSVPGEAKAGGSLFSTYSTSENRVTASIIAVLRSLSLDRIERLLGELLEISEFELVRFENQFSQGGEGVPDALIRASVRILVETKTERNAVKLPQIERHLKRLKNATETTAIVLVLTPDDARPPALKALDDRRVAWASFARLDQAVEELLEDKREVVSEREAFLLRELQKMLSAEDLICSATDVVVVAARNAWPKYNEIHAYVCQPNRPFQQVTRMAFYSKGQIYPLVPKILESHNEVVMKKGAYSGVLGDLISRLMDEKQYPDGETFKVMILSAPDSPDTMKLPQPIPNDMKSKSGKVTAFTMGQRYVSSEGLLKARTTTDL